MIEYKLLIESIEVNNFCSARKKSIQITANFNWNILYRGATIVKSPYENSSTICTSTKQSCHFHMLRLLDGVDINQCIVRREISKQHQSIMPINLCASPINLCNYSQISIMCIAIWTCCVERRCRYFFHLI